MKTTFEEIKIKGTKHCPCFMCGKKLTRSKTFFQTINPWNKLPSGEVKSAPVILEELKKERELWMVANEACSSC